MPVWACELDRLGLQKLFYDIVPRKRAELFGLPAHCHRGPLPIVAPLFAWRNYASHVRARATFYL